MFRDSQRVRHDRQRRVHAAVRGVQRRVADHDPSGAPWAADGSVALQVGSRPILCGGVPHECSPAAEAVAGPRCPKSSSSARQSATTPRCGLPCRPRPRPRPRERASVSRPPVAPSGRARHPSATRDIGIGISCPIPKTPSMSRAGRPSGLCSLPYAGTPGTGVDAAVKGSRGTRSTSTPPPHRIESVWT